MLVIYVARGFSFDFQDGFVIGILNEELERGYDL